MTNKKDEKKDNKLVIRSKKEENQIMAMTKQEEIQLLKDTYAKGATDVEFKMLVAVGNQVGASPLRREIYLMPFWDTDARKMAKTPVVGIDWYRKQAGKSPHYAGQDEAEYGEMVTSNGVKHPEWCVVPVYSNKFKNPDGSLRPIRVKVYWEEVAKTDKQGNAVASWKSMPRVMLAKCSEAQAIRRAFPEEVGGVYVEEEIYAPQGSVPVAEAQVIHSNADDLKDDEFNSPDKITKEYISQIRNLLNRKGKSEENMLKHYKKEKLEDFTGSEAENIIMMLESAPDVKKEETKKEAEPEVVEGEIEDDVIEEMPEETNDDDTPPPPVNDGLPPEKPNESKAAKAIREARRKQLEKQKDSTTGVSQEVALKWQMVNAKKRKTQEEKDFIDDVNAGKFLGEDAYPTIFKQ